jgi:hypothetical protein
MQNTHTGGHDGQKMRPVWVKRGLYWRITCFGARGEYMIRLHRLNKYILFTAHGRRDVGTPVHAWGPPRPHLIVQCSDKDEDSWTGQLAN